MAGAAAVVGLLGGTLLGFTLPTPFGSKEIDRSPAVILRSIEDMARYQAASATFQVIVDVEKDVKYVPSVIAGDRALYVAQGSVDGYVDFKNLGTGAIKPSADNRSVTVTLPAAELSAPHLDNKASRVFSRQRGVLDRVGSVFSDNPTSERELQLKAEERLKSAAEQSELQQRTENNTKKMLTGMLRGFGFETVTVRFDSHRAG